MQSGGYDRALLKSITRYRVRTVLFIAVFWTMVDFVVVILQATPHLSDPSENILLRIALVFFMSLIMAYLFVFSFRAAFRNFPLIVSFVFKSVALLLAAFLMNFLVHLFNNTLINHLGFSAALNMFFYESLNLSWLLYKTLYWFVIFIFTQLYIEINDKYSPGVFWDIVLGKYARPVVETRVVMFLDLKDSTPLAEKMGHENYFLFIREFIFDVSLALIEYNGRIYQYVGDEIVVSWLLKGNNVSRALKSIIKARRNIQKKTEFYRRKFGFIPEFRVGLHVGEVTVGEIGVIKKDLAMSGDTMNTTARIRSLCNEMGERFIISGDFLEHSQLEDFQVKKLGMTDLKGKKEDIELYALQI